VGRVWPRHSGRGRPLNSVVRRHERIGVKIAGVTYSFTMGSDLVRDGMFLEAEVDGANPRRTVAEVFYSDASHQFTVSCFEEALPIELVEHLIFEGRKRLTPRSHL
jgi:uncharacterized protein YkuJ